MHIGYKGKYFIKVLDLHSMTRNTGLHRPHSYAMRDDKNMPALEIGRVAIYCNRHKQAWISADAKWDYFNLVCSTSLATFLIGFEYVWLQSRHDLKKDSIGLEWHPKF